MDLRECGAWIGNVAKGKITQQALRIEFCEFGRDGKQGLDLRSKQQTATRNGIVQGLLAESVAGKKQALTSLVPNCKGEHPPQFLNTVVAVLFIEMDNCLSVSCLYKSDDLASRARAAIQRNCRFPR